MRAGQRVLARWGIANAAGAPCRSAAAVALARLGRAAEAKELASEELAAARRFGAPGTLGVALRAAGLVEGGTRGIELLREAVGRLERSPARLQHARALADIGAALRRSGRRREAQRPPARRSTSPTAAAARRSRAGRAELVITGAAPARARLGPVGADPSELRVPAGGQGLTNRQIAQALFVSHRPSSPPGPLLPEARHRLARGSRAGAGRRLSGPKIMRGRTMCAAAHARRLGRSPIQGVRHETHPHAPRRPRGGRRLHTGRIARSQEPIPAGGRIAAQDLRSPDAREAARSQGESSLPIAPPPTWPANAQPIRPAVTPSQGGGSADDTALVLGVLAGVLAAGALAVRVTANGAVVAPHVNGEVPRPALAGSQRASRRRTSDATRLVWRQDG